MSTNFINKYDRTYLIENPNHLGEGEELGYYRKGLYGIVAVCNVFSSPYSIKEFATEEEARNWLLEKSK